MGVTVFTVDVTDRVRSHGRLDLLQRASTVIGSDLDLVQTAQELADLAVPDIADTVVVDILESVLRGGEPVPATAAGRAAERVAFSSAETDGPDRRLVGELNGLALLPAYARTLTDLQPRLIRRMEQDGDWMLHDTERARRLIDAGVHSLLVVPLAARGVVIGVAGFYRWANPAPFEEDDLTLLTEIAGRAALYMDNARKYTREQAAARTLQRTLLPADLPSLSAVDAACAYVPSTQGGEWFDVIPLSGARVALVVGVVKGSGIHAAAAMGGIRTAGLSLSALDLAPDELLARLNDMVVRFVEEAAYSTPTDYPMGDRPTGATCAYAVYDPVSQRCTLALAGHTPPLLFSPGGDATPVTAFTGPPLGVSGASYENTEIGLTDNSVLALYTEGLLTAAGHPPAQTLAQLERLISHPNRSLRETCEAVTEALVPARTDHDAVLLLARAHRLAADHVASWTLPPESEIVHTARTLARQQLEAWGLQDIAFDTSLIVSELVTNAVVHASGPLQLRLILDRVLTCEVSDENSTAPHLRHARPADEGGRGLFIVANVTERWGTRYTEEGKTVWTEQKLPPSPG
ncbi:SpoIIE family protein phosphatase [Streptomyces sp. NPDC046805]|uniref:ATP-binding SpoIIE family protein phosphatase n=1 Tax=Streptomyces sp. NPDC046805 TaxID=3155134 RepID=UPI0033EE6867